ncbi:hypothetical protein CRG98_021124 [Punica granatum]|uniref:Uncharacterized protein n=1 Tax=Punica granatum TaxID=22663 RepID=A0A2I0JQB3_PUNGR|nr:hypothetical protein CRG98_021124 [Punica granatum]
MGCRKVSSHGLADPARLQEARASWLGELALQESNLARVSRPDKVSRGKRDVGGGSASLRCKKVNSHGLADPARLQEARARWLGELAVQESKLARVSRPGKVTRGTSEVARRTCGAGKKVISYGLADPARLQEARARWLANLRCKKLNSHGLADPAWLQEARARWLANLRCKKLNSHGLAHPAMLQEA